MTRVTMFGAKVTTLVAGLAVALVATEARAGHCGSNWSFGFSYGYGGSGVAVSYTRPYSSCYAPAPYYDNVVYARPVVSYASSCYQPVYYSRPAYRTSYAYAAPRVVHYNRPVAYRGYYSRPSYGYAHRGGGYARPYGGRGHYRR